MATHSSISWAGRISWTGGISWTGESGGIAKSRTRLSTQHHYLVPKLFYHLEQKLFTH